MKQKLLLSFLLLLTAMLAAPVWAACTASVNLAVRGFSGNVIPQAKFAVYEQIYDANGLVKPGRQLAAGTTDKYSGRGIIKVPVAATPIALALLVANPSLKNADFWYLNQLSLACDQSATGTVSLSNIYLRALDSATLTPQQNIKFTVYSQAQDSVGEPLKGIALGSFTTGDAGDVSFYLPPKIRSLSEVSGSYMLEIKNKAGVSFWLNNVRATDSQVTGIDYKFSEALFTVKDAFTGNPLPGVKFSLFKQANDRFGQVLTGNQLLTLTTNEAGQAYLQYPAGLYTAQFKLPSGKVQNYQGLKITDQQRSDFNLVIVGSDSSKCNLKSSLKPGFRGGDGKILGNLRYNIYQQKLTADGNPIADIKLVAGKVDQYGSTNTSLTVSPVLKYAMEVCDQAVDFGCFWFFNLSFACGQGLIDTQTLPQTRIILRKENKALAVGQKFKIFLKGVDVDGNPIVDRSKTVGSFTVPASGEVSLRLSSMDWQGNKLSYALVTTLKNKELIVDFQPDGRLDTTLEYTIKAAGLANYQPAAIAGVKGRILLQVESRGEAWYVNPADGLRYYMANAVSAFEVMRHLGVGIKTADLNRIPIAVVSIAAKDSDSDGLPDDLEFALGTNAYKADSDGDGYSDYSEVMMGFNPLGPGNMPIDEQFANAQAGKILLQIDQKGEAWYVFPGNNRRYFLGKPEDAIVVVRELGLGITNKNINTIPQSNQ